MPRPLMAGLVALALFCAPGCAALQTPVMSNPVAAAKTPEQAGLALLETYAAILEEATDLVRDPSVPRSVVSGLAQAEQIATPAAELVRVSLSAYLRARADYELAQTKDRPALERASAALAIAGVRLNEAIVAARAPVAALRTQVSKIRKTGGGL